MDIILVCCCIITAISLLFINIIVCGDFVCLWSLFGYNFLKNCREVCTQKSRMPRIIPNTKKNVKCQEVCTKKWVSTKKYFVLGLKTTLRNYSNILPDFSYITGIHEIPRDFMIKMNSFTFSQKLLEITKHTLKYMTGGVQESSLLGFVSLNLDCSCRILVTVTPPCHDYSTVRVFPIIYTHCSLWLSTQF